MRKQKSGTIVNMSSVGGRLGIPALSAYHSTKFALEGLSESISYELEPFGIRVVLIEPGFIRTNIMNSSIIAKKAQDPSSPYFSLTRQLERSFKLAMKIRQHRPRQKKLQRLYYKLYDLRIQK